MRDFPPKARILHRFSIEKYRKTSRIARPGEMSNSFQE